MEKNNLLLFGSDYFIERKPSEKAFWNDLVERVHNHFEQVVVLSVNNRDVPQERISDNTYLYNVRPYYLWHEKEWKDQEYSGTGSQSLPLLTLGNTYSFVKYIPLIGEIISKHRIGIIHYMRVFGLLNEILTHRHPEILFTVTVPTHVDRGFPLHYPYHWIKNRAIKPMDKIIPTTEATKIRLERLGFGLEKLEVIRWALRQDSTSSGEINVAQVKHKLNIRNGAWVVLWSGPLQGTGPKEFFRALEIAEKVVDQRNDIAFIFAFKPDRLEDKYRRAVSRPEFIKVIETDQLAFSEVKAISNLFLTPVCSKNRTVAPPLTWIEMMYLGIPVITTRVDGTAELIKHGQNGYLFDAVEETVDFLIGFKGDEIRAVGACAKAAVEVEYNISKIAEQYVRLWQHALAEKRIKSGYS